MTPAVYPEPDETSGAIDVDGIIYEPGDQFRYPISDHPITGSERFGLCYVLATDPDTVTFFNVTEEARTSHTHAELSGAHLNKLDKKWGEDH